MDEKFSCVLLGEELGYQLYGLSMDLTMMINEPTRYKYTHIEKIVQDIEDLLYLLDKRGCFIVSDEKDEMELITHLSLYINEIKDNIKYHDISGALTEVNELINELDGAKGVLLLQYEDELHPSRRWEYLKEQYLKYEDKI